MSAAQPAYRILTKPEGEEKFTEIGALWSTSKVDTFSVRLKVGDQEIKGIMVKNTPKAAAEPKPPTAKKAAASQHKPAA